MKFDWKERIIAIGPYTRAGLVTICRLWLWDYVRAGAVRKIVRHKDEE